MKCLRGEMRKMKRDIRGDEEIIEKEREMKRRKESGDRRARWRDKMTGEERDRERDEEEGLGVERREGERGGREREGKGLFIVRVQRHSTMRGNLHCTQNNVDTTDDGSCRCGLLLPFLLLLFSSWRCSWYS